MARVRRQKVLGERRASHTSLLRQSKEQNRLKPPLPRQKPPWLQEVVQVMYRGRLIIRLVYLEQGYQGIWSWLGRDMLSVQTAEQTQASTTMAEATLATGNSAGNVYIEGVLRFVYRGRGHGISGDLFLIGARHIVSPSSRTDSSLHYHGRSHSGYRK